MQRFHFLVALQSLALASCTAVGAPSLVFFGAYFPAWLLCGSFAVIAGIAARIAMVATGLERHIPYQFLTSAALGFIAGSVLWLVSFS